MSREDLNRGAYVVCVPLTTGHLQRRKKEPSSVFLRAGQFGLSKDCVAQAEAIAVLPKEDLELDELVGRLDKRKLAMLIAAVGNMMSACCSASK